MKNSFIIRLSRYYRIGDDRFHIRQVWDYGSLGEFLEAIRLITKNPRYMYTYYITSTSTPSFPFVSWSKQTRLPVECKGKDMDLTGIVFAPSDIKFDNYDIPF